MAHFNSRPVDVRFWEKVNKATLTGCWEWVGAKRYFGHGNFWLNRKNIGSHQASWLINRGPIPKGACVLHACDNPPCVNPEHLFLGSLSDNSRDCIRKGRFKPHGRPMNGNSGPITVHLLEDGKSLCGSKRLVDSGFRRKRICGRCSAMEEHRTNNPPVKSTKQNLQGETK